MTGPERPERYAGVSDAVGPGGVVDPAWVHDDGQAHTVMGNNNVGLLDPVDAGHVWCAQAVYRVHPETFDDGPVMLDPENMAGIVLGCWTCGTPYAADLLETPCPGRPAGSPG